MNTEPNTFPPAKRARVLRVAGLAITAALAVGVSGFCIGLRQASRFVPVEAPPERALAMHTTRGSLPSAPRYRDIPANHPRPNAGWSNDLRALEPRAGQAVAWDHAEARSADWRARRAYDGAPPVVPHAIDQTNPMSCLACHESPTQVGTRLAPAMSHPHYANCLQCHASSRGTGMPGEVALSMASDSLFIGAFALDMATRAGEGAPPTIPHTVTHRESCLSCHGPQGNATIRTTHPERGNCLQCHASNAELDQAAAAHWLSDFIRESDARGGLR
jgi:nitrate reductase (cytochrome), electron transfer subunit